MRQLMSILSLAAVSAALIVPAVARLLTAVGSLAPGDRSYAADTDIAVAPEWNAAHVRLVAFVQERDSRRIVGGAATPSGLSDRQGGRDQR